ncbi:MAG: replication factor C large subunit [Candidatus Aramenus sulfurataquae]|jgi:replication factor C large subunit|uniref:Replication factor C large subunit n=2 Tax=Candidatus Aramenus sulfurataquae TaxID=1326980 RepID=A0A0F2LUE0_9CREN|nr:replication factor C large subunit [Candidatus Aramenus sulfurataquae]
MSRVPWIIKYRPKSLNEIENQDDVKEQVKQWMDSWLKGKPEAKAILLYGPPGSGKTTLALALARDYKMELLEMNASDSRNLTAIKNIAERAATSGSLFGTRGKIIFLDEVDGINTKEDTGAIPAILELIQKTKYPVIMAANDPWDPSLRELRNSAKMIEVKKLGKYALKRILTKICQNEKIECEDEALSSIIDLSDGDARYAINILQSVAEGYKKVTKKLVEEISRRKESELDPFETLRSVFWAKYAWQAKNAVTSSQVDYDLLIKWFSENIPLQYSNMEDVWRAYDALSRASIFLTRAKLSDWGLLSYVFDLMGPGVALAEKGKGKPGWKAKWVKYQFPQTIQLLSKTKETREIMNSILEKIGKKMHSSTQKVLNDVYPFFTQYYNEKMGEKLDFSPREREYVINLRGRREETGEQPEEKRTKRYYKRNTRRT